MEVYQIRVFLEVARHLSFTEAADALNLTQPAVSAKIKSLESELGTSLFHRLGRKIQLTEVGEFLLEEGAKLIQVENQLIQKIEQIKKGKHGSLKIGCTMALAEGWLPKVVFEYRQQYPTIQVQCLVFESAELLYQAMTSQTVDVGISDVNFEEFSELSTTAIDTISYHLFVAHSHPLAKQQWLSLADLRKYPWALLPPGTPSRLVLESRLLELGLLLDGFLQFETVDTMSLMRTYMMQGNYLGFATNFDFKPECELGTITAIALQEFALSGTVYLVAPRRLSQANTANSSGRRSRNLNPTQKFIHLLQTKANHAAVSASNVVRLRSPHFTRRSNLSSRPEILTLSIGVQNSTIPAITAGLIIQRLGLLEHFLPKDGRYSSTQYQIQWHDFSTGAPIIDGLRSQQLNIGILGDYPLLLSAEISQKTRLISFVSTNPDGSCNAVVVPNRSHLQSVDDLRGRAIAVPLRSSAHGMVLRSLNATNLLDQVNLLPFKQENSAHQFEFSQQYADGYAHFAPFHEIACRRGQFRYLDGCNPEALPAFYGVVITSDLAEQHPEIAIAYLRALSAAQYWYDTTSAAPSLVAKWTHLDPEMIVQILSSSYQQNQPGRFFSEMQVRPDWLQLHIDQLSQIPGSKNFQTINLDQWVQPEFLQQIQA
ncbi:MAG: LysR substrate-binding domain-containing protein [Leptolyngbya sp. Prado105]|jgi:NitT/TauT family transport system substrate-binding protein|nr:LysR substrate-binding domain-containing protein [Leptolyngbya sp. Prado105]